MNTVYTKSWTSKNGEVRVYLNEVDSNDDFGYVVINNSLCTDKNDLTVDGLTPCIVSHKINHTVDADIVIAALIARSVKKQIPLNANATLKF